MDEVVFCDNCGLAVKPEYVSGFKLIILSVNGEECYFCNEKCKNRWIRKQQQILTKRHGKRENYGVKGI